LQRRYAGATVRDYVRQIEAEGESGPQTCLIVSGRALPHGGDWLVRVRLWDDGRGSVERRSISPAFLHGPMAKDVELTSGDMPLSPDECGRIRQATAACEGVERDVSISSTVIDGAPASLAVWERHRGVNLLCDCNLAGVPHDKRDHPAMRLVRLIVELAQKVQAPPLVVGSCEFGTGDITITGI
jgi:hypothetical protein